MTLPTVALTPDGKAFYCPRLTHGFLCGACIHVLLTEKRGKSTKCTPAASSCPACHAAFEHQSTKITRPFRPKNAESDLHPYRKYPATQKSAFNEPLDDLEETHNAPREVAPPIPPTIRRSSSSRNRFRRGAGRKK